MIARVQDYQNRILRSTLDKTLSDNAQFEIASERKIQELTNELFHLYGEMEQLRNENRQLSDINQRQRRQLTALRKSSNPFESFCRWIDDGIRYWF